MEDVEDDVIEKEGKVREGGVLGEKVVERGRFDFG